MKGFIYRNTGSILIVWLLTIFILCATPGNYIPSVSWLELLSFDKLVHAGMFFILNSLFFLLVFKQDQKTLFLFLYFSLSVAYGVALEWMQANVFTNRSADWQDIVANTIGCTLALLFYNKLKRIFSSLNK